MVSVAMEPIRVKSGPLSGVKSADVSLAVFPVRPCNTVTADYELDAGRSPLWEVTRRLGKTFQMNRRMKSLFNMRKNEPERHRRPLKEDSFRTLIKMGVPIGAILDVGVKTATYELIRAFPDKFHLLMEPIVEWNNGITTNYSRGGVSHEIVNVAVSDTNGDVKLKTSSVYKDKPISHARIADRGDKGDGPEYRTVQTRTLDSLVAERELAKPYLLKIDVDGAELSVLAGAKQTMKDCSVVVIETGITNIVERAQAVQSAGFQPFDIVDISYYDDRFVQADMFFLSLKVIQERNLGVYRDGFDITKWKNYVPT